MVRRRFATLPWLAAACVLLLSAVFLDAGSVAYAARPLHSFTGEQLYRGIILGHGEVANLIPEVRDNYRIIDQVKSVDQLRLVEAAQDRIVAAIERTEPRFFRSFARKIRSGDHLEIERALADAGRVTVAAVQRMPEIQELRQRFADDPTLRDRMVAELQEADPANQFTAAELDYAVNLLLAGASVGDADPLISLAVVIVAVGAIVAAVTVIIAGAYAVTLNVAAAINVAAAVVAYTEVTVTDGLTVPGTQSLLREQLIDSVALRLAT